MGQLEDTFNLPEMIENMENTAEAITEGFNQEDNKYGAMVAEFASELSEVEMTEIINIQSYDTDMDEIADKTLSQFDDLMALGKDVEPRHAGEIFSAAAQMAKLALDAKTNKTNAKLKIIELSLRRKRNELLEQKQNSELNKDDDIPTDGKRLTRDDLIAMADKLRNEEKLNDKPEEPANG